MRDCSSSFIFSFEMTFMFVGVFWFGLEWEGGEVSFVWGVVLVFWFFVLEEDLLVFRFI